MESCVEDNMGISFSTGALAFAGGAAKAMNDDFDRYEKSKEKLRDLQIALDVERYKTKEKEYNAKQDIWDKLEPIRSGRLQGEPAFELLSATLDPEGRARESLVRMWNTNSVHEYLKGFDPGEAPTYKKGDEIESLYGIRDHPLAKFRSDQGVPLRSTEALGFAKKVEGTTSVSPMNPTGKKLPIGEWELKGNLKDGLIRVNKTTNEWEIVREPAPDKPAKVTVPSEIKLQNERDALDTELSEYQDAYQRAVKEGKISNPENKKLLESEIARITRRRDELNTILGAKGTRVVKTIDAEGNETYESISTGGTPAGTAGTLPKPTGAERPVTKDILVQQEQRRAELARDLLGGRSIAAARDYNINNRKGLFTPGWAPAEVVLDNPDTKEVENYPQNIDESFTQALDGRVRERLKAGESPEQIRTELNKWVLVPDPRTKGRFGGAPKTMMWVPDTLAREPDRLKSYMDTAKKEGWTAEQIMQLFEDDGF